MTIHEWDLRKRFEEMDESIIAEQNFAYGQSYMLHKLKKYIGESTDNIQVAIKTLNFIRKESTYERQSRKYNSAKTI
jgi:hypothetical protein